MPKKSTKSKSKRVSLKQKYKVKKKIKEHHKKKKKELKKAGGKVKGPKDPGLPSQWPFKEELIKEFAFKRAQILADEKMKKEQRKARRNSQVTGGGEEAAEMSHLQAAALGKQVDFDTRKRARLTEDFQSDKDNSKKAFYREFKKVVELADVVIQVLDARDPLSCRCLDVERYIRQSNPNKRIILLLNKMDLVPREVGEQWLKFFREELPTIAFKCSTQQQSERLGRKKGTLNNTAASKTRISEDSSSLQGSTCLGADTLIQLLKNYCRNSGIKTAITVGVVGLPNVGKSSLINSLKRSKVAQVGNTPGVTKSLQEVHLDKNIKLLDSPGIVFASADSDSAAVLRNCVKIEKLADPISPIAEILKRVPTKQLMQLYKVAAFKDADQFLQLVAQVRGKLRKGGTPDMQSSARVVLQDWNDGRIPYFTSPPSRGNEEHATAEVVGQWAKEFDAELVFANEKSAVIAHLDPMEEEEGEGGMQQGVKDRRAFFQLESIGGVQVDLAAMEEEEGEEDDEEEDEDDEDEDEGGDDEDEDAMDDDEEYGAPRAKRARGNASGSIPTKAAVSGAALLYSEEGQLNLQKVKADKKKAKKKEASEKEARVAAAIAKKQSKKMVEEQEDFDFDEANEAEDDEEDDMDEQ